VSSVRDLRAARATRFHWPGYLSGRRISHSFLKPRATVASNLRGRKREGESGSEIDGERVTRCARARERSRRVSKFRMQPTSIAAAALRQRCARSRDSTSWTRSRNSWRSDESGEREKCSGTSEHETRRERETWRERRRESCR